jgi:hypothetical protein
MTREHYQIALSRRAVYCTEKRRCQSRGKRFVISRLYEVLHAIKHIGFNGIQHQFAHIGKETVIAPE